MKKSLVALLLILVVGGCALLISDDHFSRKIASINTGLKNDISTEIMINEGRSELLFVVKKYNCSNPLNGSIQISMNTNGKLEEREVKLSDLTWPRYGNEYACWPIGFFRVNGERPLGFSLPHKRKVMFRFKNTPVQPGVTVDIWSARNSKLGLQKVLGE